MADTLMKIRQKGDLKLLFPNLELGTWNLEPISFLCPLSNSQLETRNSKPLFPNSKLETRNSKLNLVRCSEFGVRSVFFPNFEPWTLNFEREHDAVRLSDFPAFSLSGLPAFPPSRFNS